MDRLAAIAATCLSIAGVAAVIAWLMWRWLKRSEEPARLVVKWIQTLLVFVYLGVVVVPTVAEGGYSAAFGGIPMAAVGGLLLAFIWGSSIGRFFANPIAALFDGGSQEMEPHPSYDIGQSLTKKGHYQEAAEEFEKQLALFPRDFTGHTLLADLQMHHLHDAPAAMATLERFVKQSRHARESVAYALNRISDWRLQAGEDEESVREPLERIVQLFPDTEVAQTAWQRLAHLRLPSASPGDEPRRIPVPHSEERLGLRDDFKGFKAPEEDLSATAARLVHQLEQHPQDWEAREQLARIYIEHFHHIHLAVDQLEQLVAQPGQPAKKVVCWLNMMADFYARQAGDLPKARATLQRIIDRDPNSGPAATARQRMAHLALELRAQKTNPAVKLGSYDQNIGLKQSPPKPPGET
jgi:tetratricopeptide (TPR) repeat protein